MHHNLQHAVTTDGKTLLPHYLGMYRLTVNNAETYWIVMRNVFSSSVTIHRKFDLKGSTVDRAATHKEKVLYVYTYKCGNCMICLVPPSYMLICVMHKQKLYDTICSFLSGTYLFSLAANQVHTVALLHIFYCNMLVCHMATVTYEINSSVAIPFSRGGMVSNISQHSSLITCTSTTVICTYTMCYWCSTH